MAYPALSEPIPGSEAFRAIDDEHALSQAALILVLGYQLRGDDRALEARVSAVSQAIAEPVSTPLPEEDLAVLGPPRIAPTGQRPTQEQTRERLEQAHGLALEATLPERPEQPLSEGAFGPLADRLYEEQSPDAAAVLLEACLWHPHTLVRVAAAATYFDLSSEPARLLPVLRAGLSDPEELTREVAATALSRVAPEDEALGALTRPQPPGAATAPSATTLLIHGTWARNGSWWQPGGDFFEYLQAGPRPDVYGAADRFSWSGGYSDAARALGALDLLNWVTTHGMVNPGPDLMTHSHGGNVALLATNGGLELNELVLLSCPVHVPKYLPDFSRIQGPVVSIHVRLDLVILADRGGQRFNLPGIQEHVLPVWFNHSATHDPAVWQKDNVPQWL